VEQGIVLSGRSGARMREGTESQLQSYRASGEGGRLHAGSWTAPASGFYNIAGLFQRDDTAGVPVNVHIIENRTTTLFAADNFSGFGNQAHFNLSHLFLSVGTLLDFAEGAPQPYFNSTGLEATISSPSGVPEGGSTALLLSVGLAGLSWFRRRLKDS
jgi:hypothetical protein